MRVAFLSDLHGNIQALTAVKRFLGEHAVQRVVVVGDLVGYGASPGPVIDFVRREGWACSLGSSDLRVALDLGERASRRGVAEQVLNWTRQTLSAEQTEFLRGLPPSGRLGTPAGRVRYFHGAPHDPEGRVDLMGAEAELAALAGRLAARVVVVGGTHVPFVREVEATTFVDPGSVGLSLNHEPGADLALVDCGGTHPRVSLHKVPYDYASSAFDILAWDLPPVIADVIRSGRMA